MLRRTVSDADPVELDPSSFLVGGARRHVREGDVVGCLMRDSSVTFYVNGTPVTKAIDISTDAACPVVSFGGPGVELLSDLNVDLEAYPSECSDVLAQAQGGDGPEGGGVGGANGKHGGGGAHSAELLSVATRRTQGPAKPLGAFASQQSGYTMSATPHVVFGEEEEEEEDLTERLIAAWEAEVFPKIHGRFRSAAERQNGFEQIRGARQFNMPEVAVDTVAGLYDESGGMPADFHLPTMDDLKASAGRLSASEIAPGMHVRNIASGADVGFEVHSMAKTRGLTGTVLRVDTVRSLALVEIYIPMDAALAHWCVGIPPPLLLHFPMLLSSLCVAHRRLASLPIS